MSGTIVAPRQRELGELSRQLADWLSRQLPAATEVQLRNLDYPRGAGQSHETILFDAHWREGAAARSRGLVVRIRPASFTMFPDTLFEQQYRLMRLLHAGGYVRVAEPLWFEADAAVLGTPFFVMERKYGRVPVSVPPYAQVGWVAEATPAQRAHMWESGVRQLAAVQRVPLDELGFLRGPTGARDGLAQEFDKYTRFVAWLQQSQPWPVLEAGLARLRDRWPRHQPPGLVWGDARLGNMMFDEKFDVIAVMDWEQPSLGGALHDLAWWLTLSETMHGTRSGRPPLAGMGTRADTLALWQELTGIPTDDIEWYEEFTELKMSCLGVRMAALRGAPPPDPAWLARRLKVATG